MIMYFLLIKKLIRNIINYEFFKNIENYIEKAISAESTTAYPKADTGCNHFVVTSRSYITDKERAKIICKQFINLYDSLDDCKSRSNIDSYRKCSKFLNYWINFKLRESVLNDDDSFCYAYNGIESQFTSTVEYHISLNKIYHIDKDELDKMNKLYNLYDKYSEINSILDAKSEQDKQKLLTLSTQCCTDYNEARYICNPENNINNNNSKFCQELNKFESKYEEEIYKKVNEKGDDYTDHFIKLKECPNNKIITTAVTGSIVGLIPLLGILYKVSELNIKLQILYGYQ
ncbi:hypothetical protein PVMG_05780 [Plasmodium vivax Mauritania I]|uniref:Uncharacterized protein n=1 Tax=Plasmodium vivax Mauritania I TaxID=1035515 RepID=A0A0J9TIC1_PLAVI|nr:hypothetical protein PVMG_05780 [Plasmodium vivax Mauritania I]